MGEIQKVSFKFDRENPTATETYLTTRSTVVAEARALMGGMQFINGFLVYVSPARQVDTGLICLAAEADVNFVAEGTDSVDLCYLVVEYGIPETDESSDLGSVSIKLGGEMMQLERGAYRWTAGAKSGKILSDEEDIKPFVFIPQSTATVKNNFKEQIDVQALSPYTGRVNSAPLILPGLSNPILTGYGRFDGVEMEKKFSTDAYQYWEATYNFALAGHKWNELWDGNQFSAVTPTIYQTADLNAVFNV